MKPFWDITYTLDIFDIDTDIHFEGGELVLVNLDHEFKMCIPWKSKNTARYLPGFVDSTPLLNLYWNTCIDTKKPFKCCSTWTSRAKTLPTGKKGEFRTSYAWYHLQESAITSSRSHVIICTGILFTTFFMWNSGLVCKCRAIHKHVFALVFHSLVVSWSGFS